MMAHLTLEEREVTISREVRRNRCAGHCWASQAQQLAEQRRRQARVKSAKMNRPEVARYVQENLRRCLSPEQILLSLVERHSGYLEFAWVADAKSVTVTRALAFRLGDYPALWPDEEK